MNHVYAIAAYLRRQAHTRVHEFELSPIVGDEPLQAIVVRPQGGAPASDPGGPSALQLGNFSVGVDCYGDSYASAADLMDRVTRDLSAMRGYTNDRTTVYDCTVSDYAEQNDNELDWPSFTASFIVNAAIR